MINGLLTSPVSREAEVAPFPSGRLMQGCFLTGKCFPKETNDAMGDASPKQTQQMDG